jgi:hypothetical protein
MTGLAYILPTDKDEAEEAATDLVTIPRVMWSDLLNVAYAMAGRTDGRLVIQAHEYDHEGAQVGLERNEAGTITVELMGAVRGELN